ncbi:MAG: choice-of-anchor D domain-containing protein [Candidatus Didemnitutus sp.]|nr:choice-of-anchor D domain-containing protein [Candidatus Didemnitutus sp.]
MNHVETSVNDADGTTIGAVASNQYLELNATYSTATAAASWSSYRFTHWTDSGSPEAIYRDAWGRSVNPASFVLLGASTATAHYLPATRDTDGDGVPDWFEMEYYGTLANGAASDTDGDGVTLAGEYAAGTNPLYGNSTSEGGVATADTALITCNLAGYATYTLRSVPAGTVSQSAVVPPGTVVTTSDLAGNTAFGYWTLDGVRQQDAWGVARTQITFTVTTSDREAVAYLFTGDTDSDGVPDAFEQRYYGSMTNGAASDTDGDGVTLLAEYTAGTNPLYGNSASEGGVAWTETALITCNLAGYATYTLRSVPAGTVSQSATVTPGTTVTSPDLSGNATFGYWTLDGVRQQDAWGVSRGQISFTVTGADREAVAYLFTGDTDNDGVPDAFEQRYYGTLANDAASDSDGDGVTLLAEYTAGTNPLYANSTSDGGVAWADTALLTLDLQADIVLEQPVGTALADGGARDFGDVPVGRTADLTFTIRNAGGRPLAALAAALDGANAAEFSVVTASLPSLEHNGSTTLIVRFAPVSLGAKSAALHLASNDPDESPFDVTLNGYGVNNPPTIAPLAARDTARNTPVSFTIEIGDIETAVSALVVSGASSNPTLLPDAAIVFAGTGVRRTVTLSPAADATGVAHVTITVSDGAATAEAAFDLTVVAYPPGATVLAADDVTSNAATLHGTVTASGFPVAARFEWGATSAYGQTATASLTAPDGAGAQAASATLAGLEPWTVYHYRLLVLGSQGTATSADATLRTAGVAPSISGQPAPQTAMVGGEASFAVTASGVPAPSYAWWRDSVEIPGATTATLHLTDVQMSDAGAYRVVVSNAAGSVTSDSATLTVNRRAQSIAFDAIPNAKLGDAAFALSATASSGLAVSYASSDPTIATIAGNLVTPVGAGTVTITASQPGDATYLPAADVSRNFVVSGGDAVVTALVAADFSGSAGATPDAALFEWSGDVALNGAGQLGLSTNVANTTWLRTRAGKAVAVGDTLLLRFRAYAYAENWYPGVYGDQQPRGLRVGTDPNNAIEFYSAARTLLGMRVVRNGVPASLTSAFPAGVDSMHEYEIAVTATEATFKVDDIVVGTLAGSPPSDVLNAFFSTYDGGLGNVPVTIDSLLLAANASGYDLWRITKFSAAELLDESLSGPGASYSGDSLPNLVKYALGLDPKQRHAGPVLALSVVAGEWRCTFQRASDTTDVSCAVEVSADLAGWSTNAVNLQKVATTAGVETWQASAPLNGTPRLFFRLRATRP